MNAKSELSQETCMLAESMQHETRARRVEQTPTGRFRDEFVLLLVFSVISVFLI